MRMTTQSSITNVAILTNPLAGNGKAIKVAKWLSKSLEKLNINHQIFNAVWPPENELIVFSDCWIIGGDGTVNYFINHYPNCNKAIAVFDGGTGNDFAWKLYGDTNLAQRFNQVINNHPKPIDAGKVNEKLYINCMGVGFDGEIIKSMKAIRFLGGKLGYLLAVILKILRYKEPTLLIQSGNQTWEQKCLLALIVNSSRAGGGFYIAPDAKINDGKLDMILCEALPVWKRLVYLPIIKTGKHMHLPIVKATLGSSFNIQCAKEMPIQVDGELIYAKHIQVQVLENKFSFRY